MNTRSLVHVFSLALITLVLSSSFSLASEFDWSGKDKKIWNKAIKRVITTPPCCGACPILRMDDGKKIYGYLTDKDPTPEGQILFDKYDEKILDAVKYFDPERFEEWKALFEKKEKGK